MRSASGLMISIVKTLIGQVREIGRLIARAGADLEHLLALLRIDRRGHAADDMRAGNRHAPADVEEGVLVGAAEILLQHEFFARREQEGALVAVVPDVLVAHHRHEAIEALAQILRILAALRDAPFDELLAAVHRRRHVEGERRRHVGQRQRGGGAARQTGRAGQKVSTPQSGLLEGIANHPGWMRRA